MLLLLLNCATGFHSNILKDGTFENGWMSNSSFPRDLRWYVRKWMDVEFKFSSGSSGLKFAGH